MVSVMLFYCFNILLVVCLLLLVILFVVVVFSWLNVHRMSWSLTSLPRH